MDIWNSNITHMMDTNLNTYHAGEQLRHDASLHFALRILALGCDGIDLVQENQAGCLSLSVGEIPGE
jgi:hypothetical protein